MPVNLTKGQLVIGGIVAFIVILLGLVFAGVIPGLRKGGSGSITGALTMWGMDPYYAIDPGITNFKTLYPNVTVSYREFKTEDEYTRTLLDTLAAGKGPDIFALENRALEEEVNKLSPASVTILPLSTFRSRFPAVVEQDFAPQGSIYALPLSIDTLALFYNRNLFDKAGVALPPTTWEEFQAIIPKLVQIDAKGTITQAAAALGGSTKSMREAADILSLLMLQTGTKMVSTDATTASFASEEGVQALRFYTQFANPRSSVYTWNDALGNADDRFAAGELAIIFKYHSFIDELKAKSAFLDYRVAAMPQPAAAKIHVAYPRYWGYGVARQSHSRDLAWRFVVNLAMNTEVARGYATFIKQPPALLNLKSSFENDEELGIFVNQTLTARSWPQADPTAITAIFSDAITRAYTNPDQLSLILREAQIQVTQLMGATKL